MQESAKLALGPEAARNIGGREQDDPCARFLKTLIHLACLTLACLKRDLVKPDAQVEALKVLPQSAPRCLPVDTRVAQEDIPLTIVAGSDRLLNAIRERFLTDRVARPALSDSKLAIQIREGSRVVRVHALYVLVVAFELAPLCLGDLLVVLLTASVLSVDFPLNLPIVLIDLAVVLLDGSPVLLFDLPVVLVDAALVLAVDRVYLPTFLGVRLPEGPFVPGPVECHALGVPPVHDEHAFAVQGSG